MTSPINVSEWVRRSAGAAPDRTALVSGDRRLTWAELDEQVEAVATGYAGAGLIAGYRVAITLPNSIEFVAACFGALRAGLVAVPIDPSSPSLEVDRLVERVGARLVVSAPEQVEELAAATIETPVVEPADTEALAALMFTSGTSDEPRAAMLHHRALLANLDQMAAIDPPAMTQDDVVLGLVPFCHIFGLNAVLGLAARTGATLVLPTPGPFDAEGTLDMIATEGVTNVPAAPAVFAAWAGLDIGERLSGVRLLLSGAAPLPVPVADRIHEVTGLTVHQGYGLTEASPGVSATLCSAEVKKGSVGSALPGVEIRLSGVEQPDDPGEVLVRGPNVFNGYWPDGEGGPDADGWFATGDLGYLDADNDLYLVDRSKELILVSGFNVYPREVEAVVASLDSVGQVAVVGVPDERTGEAVKAYVVPQAPDSLTAEAVLAHCAERLARFKCPTSVELVDELPRSATGKVVKRTLRNPERPA